MEGQEFMPNRERSPLAGKKEALMQAVNTGPRSKMRPKHGILENEADPDSCAYALDYLNNRAGDKGRN
jgi:hypothetical protein